VGPRGDLWRMEISLAPAVNRTQVFWLPSCRLLIIPSEVIWFLITFEKVYNNTCLLLVPSMKQKLKPKTRPMKSLSDLTDFHYKLPNSFDKWNPYRINFQTGLADHICYTFQMTKPDLMCIYIYIYIYIYVILS
jgi:hypothetical protein